MAHGLASCYNRRLAVYSCGRRWSAIPLALVGVWSRWTCAGGGTAATGAGKLRTDGTDGTGGGGGGAAAGVAGNGGSGVVIHQRSKPLMLLVLTSTGWTEVTAANVGESGEEA